ncbi:MAG: cyclic lactone autoinducer peptide [Eubacteriales bacterium]|nr:cyclic lactone autoinducer peptide [Eubacteriales bacterium]
MKNGKKKLIEKIAVRIAVTDANTTCPWIAYQPKLLNSVKKLKKH